jgi:hypothetical protein
MRLTTPLILLATCIAIGALATPVLAGEGCANEALREEQGSTVLPDCRVYELVSPPGKNGGDVMADSTRSRAGADGSAFEFGSLTGFGDVRGTGVATEYLSVRSESPDPGTNGWVTHAITPRQDPASFSDSLGQLESRFVGDFSPDLSHGVFDALTPLTDDPSVANVVNLYAMSDLRVPGESAAQLDTACPLCDTTNTPLPAPTFALSFFAPYLAGTSADFSHVAFESLLALTSDAPVNFRPKFYEASQGVVRLAGVLPDGTPAETSIAGQGAGVFTGAPHYTPHVVSADGRRIFFTVPTSGSEGDIYMRTDGTTTIKLNASERTDCADHNPCTGSAEPDPNGAAPAQYWNASSDGNRVFFTTNEALTDNAPLDGNGKLYMYDGAKPDGDPHNLKLISVDHNATDGGTVDSALCGVIGVSDDGRYVYFTAAFGQLVAGAPTLGADLGIYVWHDDGTADGVEKFIGRQADAFDQNELLPNTNTFFFTTEARVTADGRNLLFQAHIGSGLLSNFGGADFDHGAQCPPGNGFAGRCRELYMYSSDENTLRCVSCDSSAASPTTDASDVVSKVNQGAAKTTTHLSHALSDDGGRVFFDTGEALVPGDTNGKRDVYEWERDGEGTCQTAGGCVALISSGTDAADSYFLDASGSGDDVFFVTRARLSGWDTDSSYDVYDARESHPGHAAGFPEPPLSNSACSGEACQRALSGAPGAPSFGSSLLVASNGNATPVSKEVSKPSSKAQKLKRALKACRSHRVKAKRKKCESAVRKRFGKSGGSK